MSQLFVDMDGVLADFDTGHEQMLGITTSKLTDNVDWKAVRAVPGFYVNLPPMPDMHLLWAYIERHRPIVLTGVPHSVEEAPENKRAWVRKHLGSHVEVRCCQSSGKCEHAAPGDILIDDWEKYRHLWVAKGGLWITHTNAADTILQLEALGF
jgi:hypothetical protein